MQRLCALALSLLCASCTAFGTQPPLPATVATPQGVQVAPVRTDLEDAPQAVRVVHMHPGSVGFANMIFEVSMSGKVFAQIPPHWQHNRWNFVMLIVFPASTQTNSTTYTTIAQNSPDCVPTHKGFHLCTDNAYLPDIPTIATVAVALYYHTTPVACALSTNPDFTNRVLHVRLVPYAVDSAGCNYKYYSG